MEQHRDLLLILIDLTKAFDMVNRDMYKHTHQLQQDHDTAPCHNIIKRNRSLSTSYNGDTTHQKLQNDQRIMILVQQHGNRVPALSHHYHHDMDMTRN